MVMEAEIPITVCLDGKEDGSKQLNLVEKIISVISKESPTDQLKTVIELLHGIHNCHHREE